MKTLRYVSAELLARVVRRHGSICDSAWRARWNWDSSKTCGQTGADLKRGDIKVHQGTTWILDIGVVCPGTQRYVDQGSQTTPGRAAEAYVAIKAAKYADQPYFVPFIVETGGYIKQAGPPLPGHPTGVPGLPPRRRLPDPGALQGTVTPRCAQA